MGVIRDILCCCFRTPNNGQIDYSGANTDNSLVDRLQSRTNQMLDTIPFEYRNMRHFKMIHLLPDPEPVPVVSLEHIQSDPEYERIVSAEIQLQDKLKQVLSLRQKKSGVVRPSIKKRRAPMPPTQG